MRSTAPEGVAEPDRLARVGRTIARIPVDYWVSICVYLAPIVATLIARRWLGDDPTPEEVRRLGYGWPTLEAGRWWTLVTGATVSGSLDISFIPGYTLFAVVLLEHKAKHWRTAVMVVGGQIGGVLLGLLVTAPLRSGTSAFAVEMTKTIDFGISVGGFACLGAWTCYLSTRWRRPLRWGVSCYLAFQLLLSGLIFDVSHPMGWALGVFGGAMLMRPQSLDRTPMRLPADALWIALAVVVGSAVGIVAGWNGGGVGGIFGWGPTCPLPASTPQTATDRHRLEEATSCRTSSPTPAARPSSSTRGSARSSSRPGSASWRGRGTPRWRSAPGEATRTGS